MNVVMNFESFSFISLSSSRAVGTKRKRRAALHGHSRFMIDQGTDINIDKRTSLVFFIYFLIPYTVNTI